MADTKVYDPDQVSVMICGIPVVGGFADGSMVEIDQDEDSFITVVGTLGDVTRSKKLNKVTTITLRTMQSANINAALSALHALDENAANGAGIGPSEIKDLSGTSAYFFAKSWIAKPPKAVFSGQDEAREWKIVGVRTARLDGGN